MNDYHEENDVLSPDMHHLMSSPEVQEESEKRKAELSFRFANKILDLMEPPHTTKCGGWDSNPRTPEGQDAPSEALPDLESCTFNQASLPPHQPLASQLAIKNLSAIRNIVVSEFS